MAERISAIDERDQRDACGKSPWESHVVRAPRSCVTNERHRQPAAAEHERCRDEPKPACSPHEQWRSDNHRRLRDEHGTISLVHPEHEHGNRECGLGEQQSDQHARDGHRRRERLAIEQGR